MDELSSLTPNHISSAAHDRLFVPTHRYLGEKAFHLRIVEEFFTQMEMTLLESPSEPFAVSLIRKGITELREIADEESDESRQIEARLLLELEEWQARLAARDEKIEAYHIRRYCDGLRKPLDREVFIALVRFYRDIPRSRNSQSKFDLTLTRAFSTSVSDLHRAMSFTRDEITVRLCSFYGSWDRGRSVDPGSPEDASGFDKFVAENDNLLDFRSLTASKLFDRMREFKVSLGERFWKPGVAAAAVECNIIVGNHFNGLMARESEQLGDRIGSGFDLVEDLADASPNTYLAEAVRDIGERSPELFAGP